MPLGYQRSDVYVEERDLSEIPPTIATSIGAIVFASKKGPKGRFKVTDVDKFLAKYGPPDAAVSFGHYCSLAFLEQSNQLWCVRAVGPGYSYGGVALQMRQTPPVDTVPTLRPATADDPIEYGVDFATLGGAGSIFDNLFYLHAIGPGSYSANLYARIVSDNLVPPSNVQAVDFSTVGPLIVGMSTAGSINPGTYEYRVTAQNAVGETIASALASVTITIVGTSVYLSWDPVAGATAYNIYGRDTTPATWGYIDTVGGGTYYFIDRGTIVPDILRQPPVTQTMTDEFKIEIYDHEISTANPQETFECSMLEKVDGMGRQLELTQSINPFSEYVRVISNVASFLPSTLPTIYTTPKVGFAAGNSGAAVSSSDINTGWDQFADNEEVDIRLLINGGYASPSVQMKMDGLCHSRKDCVAILDVPSTSQKSQQAIDYRNISLNLNSNRSALYTPDVLIEDQYSGKVLYVPPSGHVAAVYAYTDATTYPWFAPAGLNRGLLRVLGIRYRYNKGERDAMWAAQVSYIRNFPGLGRAVWEQRTLQAKTSGYSFMNVRRLMDFIHISLSRAVLYQVFEPNDDFTRFQIKEICDLFLRAVKKARGINRWLTVCDGRNNDAISAGNGQLNVDIFVEPTLPAEKIRLRSILTRQGANFEELIGAGALF
jgi:hypothetical protein